MSTPQPVKQPPALPPSSDGTLNATPHIVAVLTGLVTGFLTLHVGLPADYAPYAAAAVASVLTSAVHWFQAKLAE